MVKNYAVLVCLVIAVLGGVDNILVVMYCMMWLCFVIKDDVFIDSLMLKIIFGVFGVVCSDN